MATSTHLNKDMTRFELGTVTVLDADRSELKLTRDYTASPQEVWAMFTDPEKTEKWWCKIRGKAKTGSSFDLKWLNVKDEGHGIETDWWNGRVVQALEPQLLEISNSMHGTIKVELAPLGGSTGTGTGAGTRLIFTNTISVPPEVLLMSLAGWHVHLDHLQEALAGKSVDWPHWWDDFYPCWEQIHAAYAAALAA